MSHIDSGPSDARSSAIRFFIDGHVVAVADVSPQMTVLEYLRDVRGRTGSKEGCAEGDCGACTVVIAEPDTSGALTWSPVNACIRLLPTIDGKALFTVENLKRDDGTLHPAQEAMVSCHASQCGFCTPGFVMSLLGLYKNAHMPTRVAIDDALSGNLCRCTGYRPIIAAAERMGELPAPTGVLAPGFDATGKRTPSDAERALALELRALARDATFEYAYGGQRYFAPATVAQLASLYASNPGARLVAGATDVGLWVTKHHRDLGTIIYTGAVRDLNAIRTSATQLEIGAAVRLSTAFALIEQDYPMLAEVWTRFASVPIRNSGTLGGNVANGSPIGDSMPVLIALGASVTLRRGESTRVLPLEDLYLGYQKTALAPGEFVEVINVPRAQPGWEIRAYKLSKRFDQDISAVFACFSLRRDGHRVVGIRIGCGGVAATPSLATQCARAMMGRSWDVDTIAAGQDALDQQFTPLTDMRASAAYRRTTLKNLLQRFYIETTHPQIATRVLEYAP
jgi:xanthine dehydrogenase small subunit